MSWNQNGQPQQPRRIPDLGRGRLRKTQKKTEKSPDFNGLVNYEGHIISVSAWYEPEKAAPNGQMMPASFSVRASRYDPNQGQGQAQPAQQQMPYGQPQQPQYAPPQQQPAYAPQYVPPLHQQAASVNGGYAPAPGYVPPHTTTYVTPQPAQPPQQPPQWGGAPAQTRPAQAQGGYAKGEVPF